MISNLVDVTDMERHNEPSAPRPSRLLTWVPVLALASIPLVAFAYGARPVGDPDTFWHIKAGQYLSQTWAFAGPDPWGRFTSNDWVLHEWLPQLALAGAYDLAGFVGVAWLWVLGVTAVGVAIFCACRQQGGVVLALLGTMGGLVGASLSLTPRPQLVTLALLPLTAAAWLAMARDHRPRWWLIGISWLWACSHGLWVAGPLLGLAVLVGLLLEGVPLSNLRRLALVPLLSVIAAALTPVGPRLLLTPFSVSQYSGYVSEWEPPSVTSAAVAVTLAMLVGSVLVWCRGGNPVPWTRLAMWGVALGWTLLYSRTVAVGAVIAAPLTVEALSGALKQVPGVSRLPRRELVALTLGVVVCLTVSAGVLPRTAARPDRVPAGLDAALASLPAGSVVFDEYSLGGWLLLTHPNLTPVVDGRTELYSVPHLDAYLTTRAASPGWPDFFDRTQSRYSLLPQASPLGEALKRERGWVELGADRGYVLLGAPSAR